MTLKPTDFEITHNEKALQIAEAMRPRPEAEDSLIARFIRAGADAEKVARTPVERAAAVAWLNSIYAHTPEGKAAAQARLDALEARWRTEHPGEKPPGCLFGRIRRPLAGLLNADGEFTDSPTAPAASAPTPSDPGNFDPLSLLPAHLRPGTADPNDDTPGLIPVDLG